MLENYESSRVSRSQYGFRLVAKRWRGNQGSETALHPWILRVAACTAASMIDLKALTCSKMPGLGFPTGLCGAKLWHTHVWDDREEGAEGRVAGGEASHVKASGCAR